MIPVSLILSTGRFRQYSELPVCSWTVLVLARDTELPASLWVPSLWHNTGVWRTDRQTDGWTDLP